MSTLVDERVVEMSFDNKQFESNVKQSIRTIDDLKASMDFEQTGESIDGALGKIDSKKPVEALEQIQVKFSALDAVLLGYLESWGAKLETFSTNLIKSLSVDNVTAGWSKFEEKSKSVGTLVSQGNSIEEVSTVLEKLAWYTDETSYNFESMVSNIGKFTAAGVSLNDAESAMIGIANWAAKSGQEASTASTAMYQLSQALGTGAVKLQDWKSIENANMATQEFKQVVLDAAVAAGTLNKDVEGVYTTLNGTKVSTENFREVLSEGFFTSDVLLSALSKYSAQTDTIYDKYKETGESTSSVISQLLEETTDADEQFALNAMKSAQETRTLTQAITAVKESVASGWSQTFENIFGNYEESTKFWTDVSNELLTIFTNSKYARNEMLATWKVMSTGGRTDLMESFLTILKTIENVMNAIGDAWNNVFTVNENTLASFVTGFKSITDKMYALSEAAGPGITKVFTALFSTIKAILKLVKALYTIVSPLLSLVAKGVGLLLQGLSVISEKYSELISNSSKLQGVAEAIKNTIEKVITYVSNLLNKLFEWFKTQNLIQNGISKLITFVKSIPSALSFMTPLFTTIKKGLLSLVDAAKKVPETISNLFNSFKSSGTKSSMSVFKDEIDTTTSGIQKSVKKLASTDTSGLVTFKEKMANIFDPLLKVLQGVWSVVKGIWSIVKAIMPVVSKLLTLFGELLSDIGTKLTELVTNNSNKFTLQDFEKVLAAAGIGLALKKIVDTIRYYSKQMRDFMKAFTVGISDMFSSFAGMMNAKAFKTYAESIKDLAVAILIITAAMIALSVVDQEKLLNSFSVMLLLIGTLVAVLKAMSSMAKGIGTVSKSTTLIGTLSSAMDSFSATSKYVAVVASLKQFALAVLILVGAIAILNKLDISQSAVSAGILAALVISLATAMRIMTTNQQYAKSANKGAVFYAASLLIMVGIIKKLNEMDPAKSAINAGILVGIMATMALVFRSSAISKSEMKQTKSALIGYMSLMLTMGKLVTMLGKVDTKTLIKGLAGMAGVTVAMIAYMRAMPTVNKDSESFLSMKTFALNIILLTGPLLLMSVIPFEKLKYGLLATASLILTMSIATAIMAKAFSGTKVKNIKNFGPTLNALGKTLKQFAVALMLVVIEVLLVTKIVDKYGGAKVATSMAVIFGFISVFLASFLILANNKKFTPRTIAKMSSLTKVMATFAAVFVLLAISVKAIISAVKPLASLDTAGFVKSIVGLVAVVSALSLFLIVLQKATQKMSIDKKTIALIIGIAAALTLVSTAISKVGGTNTSTLGKFAIVLVTLSAALIVLSYALEPVGEKVKAIGIAFGAFAAGFGILLLGLSSFVSVLIQLSNTTSTSLNNIKNNIEIFKEDAALIASLLGVTLGIIITNMFNSILQSVGDFIESICSLITEKGSVLFETIGYILEQVLTILIGIAPKLVELVVTLITTLIEQLAANSSRIFESVATMITNLLTSLYNNMPTWIPLLAKLVVSFVTNIIQSLTDNMPTLVQKAFDMVIGLIDALGQAIDDNALKLRETINNFCKHIISALVKFFTGSGDALTGVKTAIGNLGTMIANAWGNIKSNFVDFGKNIVQGLIDGIKNMASSVKETISNLGTNVANWFKDILGIHSPSRVFAQFGNYIDKGLANGIDDGTNNVEESVTDMATTATNSMNEVINKIASVLSNGVDDDFTITPVLDLSEIQNGTTELDSMMQNMDKYSISGSNNLARTTSNSMSSHRLSSRLDSESTDGTGSSVDNSNSIVNNFTINGTNSKEIADEVAERLQQQIERRKAKWAQ